MLHRNILRELISMMEDKHRNVCGNCTMCLKNTSTSLEHILQDEVKHETKTKIFTPIRKNQFLYGPMKHEQILYTPIKYEQYLYTPIRNEQGTMKRKHNDTTTTSTTTTTEKRMKHVYIDKPVNIESVVMNNNAQPCPLSPSKRNVAMDTVRHEREVEKAKYERNIKLYQFLIDLLEGNDPCVTWISRDSGMFKIEDSDRFSKLWGEVKLNPTMNYEKLARSFRHYYKKGIMESDSTISKTGKKKLYYKFGVKIIKTYMKQEGGI